MGIQQLYNDNLRKLPNEYGDVSVMIATVREPSDFTFVVCVMYMYVPAN